MLTSLVGCCVQATNMLYGEIDRLSAAWSTLDEQNNLKVFNLVALEEKVQKLNVDVRLNYFSFFVDCSLTLRFLRFTESESRQPLLCDHATEGSSRCGELGLEQVGREATEDGRDC